MIATCIYCGHEVRYGPRRDFTRDQAHQALIKHDHACPKNPVVQERDRLRRNRDMYKGQAERQAEQLLDQRYKHQRVCKAAGDLVSLLDILAATPPEARRCIGKLKKTLAEFGPEGEPS